MTAGERAAVANPGWAGVIALALLSNPGAVIGTLSPTFVNAFVVGGMSLTSAAHMAAAEFFAMALTLLGAPLVVNRFDRRLLGLVAIIAGAAGQLLSLWAADASAVAVCRALAGAGEGLLFAVAIASLSATAAPDRAFGIAIASNQIAGTALLAIIAWIAPRAPASAAMLVTGLFIAANIMFLPALPTRAGAGVPSVPTRGAAPAGLAPIICGLAGMFLLSGGFGAVWPVVGQIGLARGVPAATLATTFSVVGFGGVVGGLGAASLGIRFGRLLPLLFGALGMALCLSLVSSDAFVVATIAVMFFWAFNLPYFLGLLAEVDKSGRLAVLTSAMIPFGIAAGQMAAGPIIAAAGFRAVTASGTAALISALLVMLASLRATRSAAQIAHASATAI